MAKTEAGYRKVPRFVFGPRDWQKTINPIKERVPSLFLVFLIVGYRLKRRWRNGTTEVVFERKDFLAKLAALVPAPRTHLARYHGILGPAAKWRPLIVPSNDVQNEMCRHVLETKPEVRLEAETGKVEVPPSQQRKNYSWSTLLKRVFEIDRSGMRTMRWVGTSDRGDKRAVNGRENSELPRPPGQAAADCIGPLRIPLHPEYF